MVKLYPILIESKCLCCVVDRSILSLVEKGRDRHRHTKTKYGTGDLSALKSTLCSYTGPDSVQNT